MKISRSFKFIIFVLILAGAFFVSFPFLFYLKILPNLVSNTKFADYTRDFVKQKTGATLTLKSLELKTSLKPEIEFNAGEISLSKDNKYILSLKNIQSKTEFKRLREHIIDLRKVGADYIFVDVNKLEGIFPQNKTQQKSDWTVNWLEAFFYVKKCYIIYNNESTKLKLDGKDISIESSSNPKKVNIKFKIDIKQKKLPNFEFMLWDQDRVYIENHKLYCDNFLFFINRSSIFVKSVADEKKHFDIKVFSDNFDLKSVVSLINSNLLVKNGSELLSMFKDIDGRFKFNFKVTDKGLSGKVVLIKGKFKVIPVMNLPVVLNSGNIIIGKKDVFFNNFQGAYGKNLQRNKFEVKGSARNYMHQVKVVAFARGLVTNEFMKNYVSPMAGCPITLLGDAKTGAMIQADEKNIDVKGISKIGKQDNLLIAGASITPKGWERAVAGDFHFQNNILTIKKLNYYIAQEISRRTKDKNPVIVEMNGNVNCKTSKILNIGFNIPHDLPSEFMNLFVGSDFFKKGTVGGHLKYINTEKVPRLEGKIRLIKVRVPSQRLRIKDGTIITDKKHIHIIAKGRYRKSGYALDGEIKNEMVFPIVVKDANLTVEKLDIEKVMKTFNSDISGTSVVQDVASKDLEKDIMTYNSDNEKESEANVYTFPPNLLVVEKCMLHVINGTYKAINFGNMHADLTLSKHGVLQVESNKFDFSEGLASCKVYCDLMKHKYSVLITAVNVNSDLIASTILELKKEISGKASTIMELYTDDSLKLNGTITFNIKNGTISKLGIIEYILKVAALFRNPLVMISPSTIVDLVNIPEGTFNRIIGKIEIKNNIARRINIKSSSPQLSSYIAGRVNLETRDSSLRIYTKFSNKGKGFTGLLRNISLNTLAHSLSISNQNLANYYASEIEKIPVLKTGEGTAQIFLTTVEGDIEHNNFLSSLKRIK